MDMGAIAASRLGEDQVFGRMVTRSTSSFSQQKNMEDGKVVAMGIPKDDGATRGTDSGGASAYTSSLTVIVRKSWRVYF